jgi:predicted extracellular nuclease
LECRGADSAVELERQTQKIVAALVKIDADIIGLIEIENDADDASAQKLVNELNAAVTVAAGAAGARGRGRTSGPYDYIKTGTIGGDAIKVALLYKTQRVKPWKDPLILDSSVDERFLDDKNRPALVQTFTVRDDGGKLTVAVNHFKSKGSSCNDVGDFNKRDGSGNCDTVRTDAAKALVDFLADTVKFPDVLVIGDLNSYSKEMPIKTLVDAGYTDVLKSFDANSYTYLFDGQLGSLDFALASPSAFKKVVGAEAWNINADEVSLFDYDDAVQDSSEPSFAKKPVDPFQPNEFRSSDHDAVIVSLKMDDKEDDDGDDKEEAGIVVRRKRLR